MPHDPGLQVEPAGLSRLFAGDLKQGDGCAEAASRS
jgi:hypothetical protein